MNHKDQIEQYCVNILEAVEHAAVDNIPLSGSKQGKTEKTLTGWNETVRAKQLDAKFWHAVWMSADKPTNGELFKLMRHTKMQYKYAARKLKRAQAKIQDDKFVQSVMNGGTNIFDEIKKFRRKAKTCSTHAGRIAIGRRKTKPEI